MGIKTSRITFELQHVRDWSHANGRDTPLIFSMISIASLAQIEPAFHRAILVTLLCQHNRQRNPALRTKTEGSLCIGG